MNLKKVYLLFQVVTVILCFQGEEHIIMNQENMLLLENFMKRQV